MSSLDKALKLISDNEDKAHFLGPRTDELIRAAETTLAIQFPPTYRKFLKELACGSIAGEEFYGIIDENFEDSGIPDAIWATLKDRKIGLPESMIRIYSLGEGTDFVLDTSQSDENGECPVVAWLPGASKPGDKLEVIEKDFGSFLLRTVSEALADDD